MGEIPCTVLLLKKGSHRLCWWLPFFKTESTNVFQDVRAYNISISGRLLTWLVRIMHPQYYNWLFHVSQCWKCYGKVIQENFAAKYFSAEFPYNKSAKRDERSKATVSFQDSCETGEPQGFVCEKNRENPESPGIRRFSPQSKRKILKEIVIL